jgi:hypothetical protein
MVANTDLQDAVPIPLLTEKWFEKRFPEMDKIRVLDGLGEQWKKRKLNNRGGISRRLGGSTA